MKALITLLIIGTSSVALAQPAIVDHRNDYAFEDRDHRFDERDRDRRLDLDRGYARAFGYRMRPVTLASNVSLMRQRNRDQRPLLIDIDSRMGTFKTLRLDRVDGRAYINDVVVMLADGHSIRYDVNKMMSLRSPSITIDVGQRAITGIYVYGMTERGRASFNVIGLRR
ncbi:MAG TPA: hypothetical protein VFV99_06695 [Kofleriaceae bacterium]|nr:hypothetical protein [Kofleriaceae bacterium]